MRSQAVPTPVIIDTDPGIDDAVAILYALRSPAFEVIGLTTVAGNIGLATTTANAGRILALAGADVPVFRGASAPLARKPFAATEVHGNDGLGGVPFPEPRGMPREGAVAWIAQTLIDRPNQTVDLLALGPLTNLAHLVTGFPGAARRIRRVIAMGGAIDERGNVGPRAEFNMAADPEAADLVLGAGLALTLIPLDVTRKVRAGPADTAALKSAAGEEARAVGQLVDAYFQTTQGGDSRPLHDPCVMLLAERPELFDCEARHLGVDLGAGPDAGALGRGPHRVEVAMGVDGDGARALLLGRFLTARPPG